MRRIPIQIRHQCGWASNSVQLSLGLECLSGPRQRLPVPSSKFAPRVPVLGKILVQLEYAPNVILVILLVF